MAEKRVQDIATKAEVPPEFIRSEEEQPGLTTYQGDLPDVPVIDVGNKDEETLIKSILDASCEWGFFQIVNHEIPNDVISNFKQVGTQFFALPPEEKEVYAKPQDAKSVEGYGTKLQREVDGKKGWVDHLFHRIAPPSAINDKFWPKNPPNYREATEEYEKYLRRVVDMLLKMLSKGLGLEDDDLRTAAGGDDIVYLLKINYYPPCPNPELVLGVPPHTDMCVFTILVPNEVQGLQVFQYGHWIEVKYIPNALVVHIGDQLEILSNGKYKSVLHRTTVNKEKERMSWPVFMEPPQDHEVGPHPKLTSDDNPPKYKKKKYSDYVYCKLNKIPQ